MTERVRPGDSRLVYSTDGGRVAAASRGKSTSKPARNPPVGPDDGVVRIGRAKRGGAGKAVMSVTGLPGSEADLDLVLKRCKAALGLGGSREGRALYLHGEDRERLRAELEKLGYRPRLAGG